MTGRRVLVCGGRDYADRALLFESLDRLHKSGEIGCIIEGGATGADKLAHDWSDFRRIKCETFEANWAKWGRSAGPRRNAHILLKGRPDLVFAFPGGAGTEDMVAKAKAAGVVVIRAPERVKESAYYGGKKITYRAP